MNSIFFLVLIAAFFYAANSQQKSVETKLPDKFFECYNDSAIVINENKLPHNMHALIAMIRKIEDDPLFQTDLRRLSVAILHRFRQDGIGYNPDVTPGTEGIIPYVVKGSEKFKCAKILEMIPTADESFPNNSLTLIQRCSMHSMLSTNFALHERGDEAHTCRTPRMDEYRYARSVRGHRDADDHEKLDTGVESLSPAEIETMNENEDGVDPNSYYPPLSPNHPASAKLIRGEKVSLCPQAGGVIVTEWGSIAGGALIAGIASGAQPQNVRVSDLMRKDWFERSSVAGETVSNKFMATLAGDLAEVILIQGITSDNYDIGVEGHWNSSISPKYYFIEGNENLEFIAAEVRGGLDGLILANEVSTLYQQMPSLRLSQVLDMYYSERGLFNADSMRACNRRAFLPAVAPNDTLFMQTWRAVEALYPDLATLTMTEDARKKFASKATGDLLNYIPSQMNNDKSCVDANIINRLGADLTIFLDTNWPWALIQPILTVLLESSEINKFASNFTLIDGGGSMIINSSNSILDFYALNETHYSTHKNKFDLAKTVDTIQALEKVKLDREKTLQIGGARSSIVLIIPYRADTLDESDKQYYLDRLGKMNEDLPDTVILFLAGGSKDRWADLARDAAGDVFSVGAGSIKEATVPIANLVTRMKKVPRRLLNSQCGSNWSGSGDSATYTNYLEPRGVNLYRLHANYFYSENQDNVPAVKVQGFSGNAITVCSSRFPIDVNSITDQSECSKVTTDTHRITISCGDAGFIHACNPLYVAISAASTNSSLLCSEPARCRFPDMVKYTISYENLLCTSGAGFIYFSRILLIGVGFSGIYLKF